MRAWALLGAVLACSPAATRAPVKSEGGDAAPAAGPIAAAADGPGAVRVAGVGGCATAACWVEAADAADRRGDTDVAASHRGRAFVAEPTVARLNAWIDALIAGGEFNKAREGLAAARAVGERARDPGLTAEAARRLADVPASGVGAIVVAALPGPIRAAYTAVSAGQLDAAAAGFAGTTEPYHLVYAGEVQARRGDEAAARRQWAAARAGFAERGAALRIEPVETYFTRTATWHGGELALMRHWNPVHEHQKAYGVLELVRPADGAGRRLYFARSSEVVAFTEDGQGFLRDEDGAVVWQDLLSGALTRTAATPGKRVSALVTRGVGDGLRVLVAAEGATTLWGAKGELLETYVLAGTTPTITRVYTGEGTHHDNILREEASWPVALAMTAGAGLVAIGGSDSKIRVFERGRAEPRVLGFTWQYTERRHMGANPDLNEPLALRFDAKERLVAVYRHGDIAVWDPRGGKLLGRHAGRCTLAEATADVNRYNGPGDPRQRATAEDQAGCGRASTGAISGDGSLVVTGGGLSGFRVRTTLGRSVHYVADSELPDQYMGFADDGTLGLVDQNGAFAVWRQGQAAPRVVVKAGDTGPITVRMSEDGRRMLFEVSHRQLVWDLIAGRRVELTQGLQEGLLAIDDGFTRVAVRVRDAVEVREVMTGKVVFRQALPAGASASAVAANGRVVLQVGDGASQALVIVEADGASATQALPGEVLRGLSDDGRWLATWQQGQGRPITVRNLKMAGKVARTLEHARAFAFSRDGSQVVSAALPDPNVPAVTVRVQALVGAAEGRTLAVDGWPETVAFTPDGQEVLVMLQSGRLTRWRWATGETTTIGQVSLILAGSAQVVRGGEVVLLPGYDHVQVRTNDAEMRRLAMLYPRLDGGWVVVSSAGAVDGSVDAARGMVTTVTGGGATQVFDGRLGWTGAHVPGLWARALAGEDVAPPVLVRAPVVEEPLTR